MKGEAQKRKPQTEASGSETVATGSETKATGSETVATGSETKATGSETKATGSEKEASGSKTEATGNIWKAIKKRNCNDLNDSTHISIYPCLISVTSTCKYQWCKSHPMSVH